MRHTSLIITVDIKLGNDGLIIRVLKLKRDTSTKQQNHIIPVASFLNTLKANIEKHHDPINLFKDLVYIYSLDDHEDYTALYHVYYQSFFKSPTQIDTRSLANILEHEIIPRIYNTWDTRELSTFKENRSSAKLGEEGSIIGRLIKNFKQLNENTNAYTQWSQLKIAMEEYIKQYILTIDISDKHSTDALLQIIHDTRSALIIAIDVILSSQHNNYLHLTKNGHEVLEPGIVKWYDTIVALNTFGTQFISTHPKVRLKAYTAQQWIKHLQETRTLWPESYTPLQAESSPYYNSPKHEQNTISYDTSNIQRILQNSTPHAIEVILDMKLPEDIEINSTTTLIKKIMEYTSANSRINTKDYLVINCDSQSLVNSAYLARLEYSGDYWCLKFISLVNQQMVIGILEDPKIRKELDFLSIEGCGVPKYCTSTINQARIEQVIEYGKARIKYPKSLYTETEFNAYKLEADKIQLAEEQYYKDQHIEESKLNLLHVMCSPTISSHSSDITFASPSAHSIKTTSSCDSPVISKNAISNFPTMPLSPKLANIQISPQSSASTRTKLIGSDSPNPFGVQRNIAVKTPERSKDVQQVQYYSPQPSTSGIQPPCKRSSENLASKSKKIMTELQSQCQIHSLDNKNLDTDRNNQYDVFESTTAAGDYTYWLQQHDLPDIARVHYNYRVGDEYESRDLEVVGTLEQLSNVLNDYLNRRTMSTFTIITNIGQEGTAGNHWVSLVLHRIDNEYHAYHADSLGNSIASNIESILKNHNILVHDVSIQMQQINGYDCGLWALENARTISNLLMTNNGTNIQFSLPKGYTQQFFESLRDNISAELRHDAIRQEHLYGNGGILAANDIINDNIQDVGTATQMIAMCVWAHTTYNMPYNRHKRSISETDDEILTIHGQDFLNCTSNINIDVLGVHFLMLDKLYKNIITDVTSCNQMNQVILNTYVTLYNKLYGVNTEILHSKLIDTLSMHRISKLSGILEKDIKNLRLLEAATGETLVITSVESFNIDFTRLLLQKGANVNARDHNGNIALYYSIQARDYYTSELLIEYGADVDYINSYGQSSIHDCVIYDANRSLIESLIEKGAKINTRDTNGNTPLALALGIVDNSAAKVLVSYGADVNNINEDDESLLYIALTNHQYNMMEELLQRGANTNVINKKGNSLLNIAIEWHDGRAAKLLIKYGGNVSYINCDGKSILYYTVKNNLYKLTKLIVNKGADINFVDNDGNTILDYAYNFLNHKVIHYLMNKGAKKGVEIELTSNIEYTAIQDIDVKDVTTKLTTDVNKYIWTEATTQPGFKHIRYGDGGEELRKKRSDLHIKACNQDNKNPDTDYVFEALELITPVLQDCNHHKHRHHHREHLHKKAAHQIDKRHTKDHHRGHKYIEDTLKINDNKQLNYKLVSTQEKYVRSDTDSRYDDIVQLQNAIGMKHAIERYSSKFIDSKASPIDNSVNNPLRIDWHGNLLLGRLLLELFGNKCSGKQCKVIQDVANYHVGSEDAHRLAYSAYAPVIEDTELVGVTL